MSALLGIYALTADQFIARSHSTHVELNKAVQSVNNDVVSLSREETGWSEMKAPTFVAQRRREPQQRGDRLERNESSNLRCTTNTGPQAPMAHGLGIPPSILRGKLFLQDSAVSKKQLDYTDR